MASDGSHSNNKNLFIFDFTSLHDAWFQSRSESKTLPKRASRFVAPIFGAHPPDFFVTDSDFDISLTHAQLLTFSYAMRKSLKDFILIKTHFFDYTPGLPEIDPDTGRRLLEVDEWVDGETIRPRVVFTEREYDVRGWQKHRDACTGIEDMMGIEFRPGPKSGIFYIVGVQLSSNLAKFLY
ncbi:hypothetical protein EV421DRAFT_2024026 [Armillaria borealis]|uniref:Uncharacterized protein n=1 Tax=Armillaria borealis TaxID=47425 RepID=A0AA39IXR3_9AGAR|nr:hypothetical protein EV421DRAFT_2024026 [Armillaria borealis]